MKSYDPPEIDVDGLSAQEAQARINELDAGFAADSEHPAFTREHPQFEDFNRYRSGLFRIIVEAKNARQEEADAQKIADMLERGGRGDAEQQALEQEIEEEIALLAELGPSSTVAEGGMALAPSRMRFWGCFLKSVVPQNDFLY